MGRMSALGATVSMIALVLVLPALVPAGWELPFSTPSMLEMAVALIFVAWWQTRAAWFSLFVHQEFRTVAVMGDSSVVLDNVRTAFEQVGAAIDEGSNVNQGRLVAYREGSAHHGAERLHVVVTQVGKLCEVHITLESPSQPMWSSSRIPSDTIVRIEAELHGFMRLSQPGSATRGLGLAGPGDTAPMAFTG